MKNLILILSVFLISATVATNYQTIEPKVPIDTKLIRFSAFDSDNEITSTLNNYRRVGYVVTNVCPISSSGSITIVIQKYK